MAYQRVTRLSMQGSVNWLAVEVVKGKGYSAKVDIWSLGCLVLEMLTGHPPWHGVQGSIIYLLGTGNHPPIPESLSPMAKAFISKCFTINPDKRPTATELLSDPWTLVDPYAYDFSKWMNEMANRNDVEDQDANEESSYYDDVLETGSTEE